MSRFVYLIASHTNPGQVSRLASAIANASPGSQIVIHHDPSKSRLGPLNLPQVHLVPNPLPVEWGAYSHVGMLLHSFQWISANLDFDWVVVVSGQDYPTQSLAQFETRLASSGYDAFIRYFRIDDPDHWPRGVGSGRYYFRYISIPRFRYYYRLPEALKGLLGKTKTWINASQPMVRILTLPRGIRTKIGIRRIFRPFNDRFICYGGWDWFNLNRRSVSTILRDTEENRKIFAYYSTTFLPSESLIHSLLVNNHEIKVFNDACRFVHWGEKAHATSPEIIRCKDVDLVLSSGQPFARKFDMHIDSAVLDRLDARIAPGQQEPVLRATRRV